MMGDDKAKGREDETKGGEAGEDEGGVPSEGNNDQVKEDQKPTSR